MPVSMPACERCMLGRQDSSANHSLLHVVASAYIPPDADILCIPAHLTTMQLQAVCG